MKFAEAIRAYFDEKNKLWITGEYKSLPKVTRIDPEADWWRNICFQVHRKRDEIEKRKVRLLRSHTKMSVRDANRSEDGRRIRAFVDESILWTYRDAKEVFVEGRIVRHKQDWHQSSGQWLLEKDGIIDERRGLSDLHKDPQAVSAAAFDPDDFGAYYRKTCNQYDRLGTLRYADLWWNGYNGRYAQFSNDCTSFISQCLFAGGMPMTGGQNRETGWWYRFSNRLSADESWSYSWSTSHALYLYLTNYVRAQRVESAKELKVGDVILYDWNGEGRYHHTTVVTDFDSRSHPLVNAHTDASYRRHYLYLDSRAWTANTKYAFLHLPDELC